jgi:hypothetical protein
MFPVLDLHSISIHSSVISSKRIREDHSPPR